MEQNSSGVISTKSEINYDYAAIKITQSRINKGLLAVPISLAKYFPPHNYTIQVYLDDASASQPKQYSSYMSSTHECRIGGLREWFQKNDIKNQDEIVVQILDKGRFIYRLIPQRDFIQITQKLQVDFDKSISDKDAALKVVDLAKWTNLNRSSVIFNEYIRLINTLPSEAERRTAIRKSSRTKETAPSSIRTLLEEIFKGHCQVCDFWFIKKDRKPYFEIHHLNPDDGHHPKNILAVCGNCHNQFEYANVKQEFENEWLVRVNFNGHWYGVRQITQRIMKQDFSKALFT